MGSPRISSTPFAVGRNLRLFYVATFVRELAPLLAIWVVYLTDYRHLTLAQVGLMEGLFWIVKLAMEVPSGVFADRFGRRTCMVVAAILEGGGLMVFAVADTFTLLTISYLIWGSGFAFRSGAAEAYLYDALQADGREAEYTDRLGFFWALDLTGATVGGIAGAILAATVSLQAAVIATAGSYVVALPLLLAMQEPPRLSASAHRSYLDVLREGLAVVRRDAGLRGMVLLQIVLMSGWAGSAVLSQPFMAQHGVPLSWFGVLSASIMLASAGAGFASGRVVRAIGITRALVVSVAGTAGGLLLLGAVDHLGAFAGFVVTAGALSVVQPAAQAYVSDRTGAGVRATVLSLAPFGQSIAIAIANTAAGVLGDASMRLALGTLGVTIGLAGVAAFLVWRAAEARSQSQASQGY